MKCVCIACDRIERANQNQRNDTTSPFTLAEAKKLELELIILQFSPVTMLLFNFQTINRKLHFFCNLHAFNSIVKRQQKMSGHFLACSRIFYCSSLAHSLCPSRSRHRFLFLPFPLSSLFFCDNFTKGLISIYERK